MRYLTICGFLIVFLINLYPVSGLQTPNMEIIPSNISVNSSFLLVGDMGATTDSIRMVWAAPGISWALGSVPKMGDKFICYFSNADPSSTCGPNPFSEQTTWIINIDVINQNGETNNATISVPVGGIKLYPRIDRIDNTLYIRVSLAGPTPDTLLYAIYDKNITLVKDYSEMEYDIISGRYNTTVQLYPGEYYIAFKTSGGMDYGGTVERVEIPAEPSQTPAVPSEHRYGITSEPVDLNILISPGDTYQKTNLKFSNTLDIPLVNLRVEPVENLSDYIEITLEKTELAPNETAYFSVKISNVTKAMEINGRFKIWNDTDVVGYIKTNISVSVIREGDEGIEVSYVSDILEITPEPIISKQSINSISKDFILTNHGTSAITNIGYSVSSSLQNVADVIVPDYIPAGGDGTITVTLSPFTTGTRKGVISINTSAGTKHILVDVTFYANISPDIEQKIAEVEDMSVPDFLEDILYTIKTDLEDAKIYFENGDYETAENRYSTALAKLSVISEVSDISDMTDITTTPTTPSQTPDMTGILILILIIIIVVGAFVYMKKIRKQKPEEGEELIEEI